jgi:hypothetical protein
MRFSKNNQALAEYPVKKPADIKIDDPPRGIHLSLWRALQQKDREEAPTETLDQLEQWKFSTVEQALALTPVAGSMSATGMLQQASTALGGSGLSEIIASIWLSPGRPCQQQRGGPDAF